MDPAYFWHEGNRGGNTGSLSYKLQDNFISALVLFVSHEQDSIEVYHFSMITIPALFASQHLVWLYSSIHGKRGLVVIYIYIYFFFLHHRFPFRILLYSTKNLSWGI